MESNPGSVVSLPESIEAWLEIRTQAVHPRLERCSCRNTQMPSGVSVIQLNRMGDFDALYPTVWMKHRLKVCLIGPVSSDPH